MIAEWLAVTRRLHHHHLWNKISPNWMLLCELHVSMLESVLAIAIPLWLPPVLPPLSEWIRRARERKPYLFLPPGIPEIFCLFAECGRTHLPGDFLGSKDWYCDNRMLWPLSDYHCTWKQDCIANFVKQKRKKGYNLPTILHGWKTSKTIWEREREC